MPGCRSGLFPLRKATSEAATREVEQTYRNQPERDIPTYVADLKKADSLYQHVLNFELVKDTEKEVDVRVAECLWVKTFRKTNAADPGYALICHGDIAATKAYHHNTSQVADEG